MHIRSPTRPVDARPGTAQRGAIVARAAGASSRPSLLAARAATLMIATTLTLMSPALADTATLQGPAKVADGDTLEIQTSSGPARVRMWGIDAVELAQACTKDGTQYACGKESKDALVEALGGPSGLANVKCTVKEKDQYGRNVASCAGPSGKDAGEIMVRNGQAVEYRQFSRGRYSAAEREAKREKKGIWAGSFQEPAQWRRDKRRAELEAGSKTAPPLVGGTPAAAAAAAPPPSSSSSANHPAGCDIKGNISQRGKKVYHMPGAPTYADVKIDTAAGERWFCTEEDATKAGWKKARPDVQAARAARQEDTDDVDAGDGGAPMAAPEGTLGGGGAVVAP